MGLIAQEMQDLPQARQWLQLAYDHVMASPSGWLRAFVMNYLADVLREMEEFDVATHLAEESLRLFISMDDSYYLPDAHMTLAQIALDQGNYAAGAALLDLAYQQYEAREDAIMIATALLVKADLAWKTGRAEEAADLLARSRALRGTASRAVSPREQAQYEKLERLLVSL
jgi:ATP/maltotriose-dependent transcriptional regulator MalT